MVSGDFKDMLTRYLILKNVFKKKLEEERDSYVVFRSRVSV